MPDASHAGRLVKDVIHEIISESPSISIDEIAERLDIGRGLVHMLCRELIREGRITEEAP